MINEIINRLLRAGFIVRLRSDRLDRFDVDVFDFEGNVISFASGKTLDEAVGSCLIDVIESQSEQILNLKQMLADTRQVVGRTKRSGPDWNS